MSTGVASRRLSSVTVSRHSAFSFPLPHPRRRTLCLRFVCADADGAVTEFPSPRPTAFTSFPSPRSSTPSASFAVFSIQPLSGYACRFFLLASTLENRLIRLHVNTIVEHGRMHFASTFVGPPRCLSTRFIYQFRCTFLCKFLSFWPSLRFFLILFF